jgi:hypothetical protein
VTEKNTPTSQLRREYDKAVGNASIGGASILWKLSGFANECISGVNPSQDAVAFALSIIFALHAEERDERIVTGDDTYLLFGSGEEHLNDAISFIERPSTTDEAIRLITALIPLTPNVLYRH